jgi:15-cis-phytoene synthase/lycopene beta-cyclase
VRSGWAVLHVDRDTLTMIFARSFGYREAVFFAVVSYLLVLSSSLISHLHFLLLLAPPSTGGSTPTPRCPPANPIRHITLLTRLALSPPPIPRQLLVSLESSEATLKAGSKSFSVAKLGWGREMRCGLIAVYGWCRVTDDLIDDDHDEQGEVVSIETKVKVGDSNDEDGAKSLKEIGARKQMRLEMMRRFLDLAYDETTARGDFRQVDVFLDTEVPSRAYSAFYLFSRLIVDLVPRRPFDDLLDGYQMDLEFPDKREMLELTRMDVHDEHVNGNVPWERISPIQTEAELVLYADRVAGSVADMIIHLTWNVLTSGPVTAGNGWALSPERQQTLGMGRKMGQALQLVNIARDVRSDVEAIGRIYIPMQWFRNRSEGEGKRQVEMLAHRPRDLEGPGAFHAPSYTLRMLRMAEELKSASRDAIADLPYTARAGTRAMVASYFEIGKEVERRGGQVPSLEQGRLRVSKRRRLAAVLWSIWGL